MDGIRIEMDSLILLGNERNDFEILIFHRQYRKHIIRFVYLLFIYIYF